MYEEDTAYIIHVVLLFLTNLACWDWPHVVQVL
jgi:hypothetical protein